MRKGAGDILALFRKAVRAVKRLCCGLLLVCLLFGLLPARGESAVPVGTPEQLLAIAQNPGGHYRLTGHIDLKGIPWLPIPFSGILDGAGYSIVNMRVDQPGMDTAQTVDGNDKVYLSRFAGLFSVVRGAQIHDLDLRNVQVDITTADNCFAAGLAGFAEDTVIEKVTVSGRVRLTQSNVMTGVGGLVGFGMAVIRDCQAQAELVFVDTNQDVRCEQFMGGVLACGYGDIENTSVRFTGFASVYGYVHIGGLVGMYHTHREQDAERRGVIAGCRIHAAIDFFEKNTDRRAYCYPFTGEKLNRLVKIRDNKVLRFRDREHKRYDKPLLPEKDANPEYVHVVTPPARDAWGFTTYTCASCHYSYFDHFTAPTGP